MAHVLPDQNPGRWDEVVDSYETAFQPTTTLYAEEALRLVQAGPGKRVLDAAAGTGTLTLLAAQDNAEVVAIDFSEVMVDRLKEVVRAKKLTNVRAEVMDGQNLSLPDNTFDAAYSIFGLIFFPDQPKGLREMHRVLKPGGRSAVLTWKSPAKLQFIRVLMSALRKVVPDFPVPSEPPPWARLGDPEILRKGMLDAGFRQAYTYTAARPWLFSSAEWLWKYLPQLSPGIAYVFDPLAPEQTAALGKAFSEDIQSEFGEGSFALDAEALIGIGVK